MSGELVPRSYEPITADDLDRLAEIAREDLTRFFDRNPHRAQHRQLYLGSALCQGAALHYLDGQNGVKDFDIYHFFARKDQWPFPERRRGIVDFGQSKFGCSQAEKELGFCRRVDLMGRSLDAEQGDDPVEAIQRWLRHSRNSTPRFLAAKAVVILEPEKLRGTIVWPLDLAGGSPA